MRTNGMNPHEEDTFGEARLSQRVKEQATRHRAPDALRAQLQQAMRAQAAPVLAQQAWQERMQAWLHAHLGSWRMQWQPLALGLAGGVLATALVVQQTQPKAQDALVQEISASHVRSLMAAHLSDVASSDQHTVKPWFIGKLDYAPPVQDYAADGFVLVGGRIDYIQRRAVAALVYQRQKHSVNLFVWPSTQADSAPLAHTQQGFQMLQFNLGGMQYWLVSDVALADLQTLARAIRAGK
jgi:anti-sigma factor RsiW